MIASIFSMGLWPIFLLLLGGAGVFGYQAYKASKSGSTIQLPPGQTGPDGKRVVESDENVPLSKIPQTYYSVFLALCAILFLIFAGR